MITLGITFNGERRSYLNIAPGWKRPAWAPIQRDILKIPNRPGGYHQRTNVDVREISIPVWINSPNLQKVKEDLAAWLITDKAAELIFDDEPERVYYALVDGTFDPNEIVTFGQGVITFICPDPYKYAKTEKTATAVLSNGTSITTVSNIGTVEAQPIIEIQVDKSYTNIDITNGEEINRIGRVVNLEDYAVEKEETVLNDKLTSIVGWAKTEGRVGIDGYATGNMKSDGYRFIAQDFGVTQDAWHGPFYKKSLGQTLTDFRLEAMVEILNTGEDKFGKVEVYLLDENNLSVCMLTIKDVDSSGKRNYATARTGGGDAGYRDIISTSGEKESTYWNFYGMLRIERVGTRWTAYVAKVDKTTGKHTARTFKEFNDVEQQFIRKPTQVGIYIAQHGTRPVPSLRADDIRVYKINPITTNQIPYIVKQGDVVTFDHKAKDILVNGESRIDLKAFGGEYFTLNRGDNVIVTIPPLPTKVTWRERFR